MTTYKVYMEVMPENDIREISNSFEEIENFINIDDYTYSASVDIDTKTHRFSNIIVTKYVDKNSPFLWDMLNDINTKKYIRFYRIDEEEKSKFNSVRSIDSFGGAEFISIHGSNNVETYSISCKSLAMESSFSGVKTTSGICNFV